MSIASLALVAIGVYYFHPQIQQAVQGATAKVKKAGEKAGLGALAVQNNPVHMGAIGMHGVQHMGPRHMGALAMQNNPVGFGAIGMNGFGAIGME